MGKSNSLPPLVTTTPITEIFKRTCTHRSGVRLLARILDKTVGSPADEQDKFLEWLDLSPGKCLLDVACGAGGPALRIATATGCSVVGIDVHEQAVTAASSLAAQRGLAGRAEFRAIDATEPLPFSDASFDAITCIDAINHFPDRPQRHCGVGQVAEAGRTTAVHRSHHRDRSADECGNRGTQFGGFLSLRSAWL